MKEIAILEEGQAKDLPSVVSAASASFSSFRDIQQNAQILSADLESRYVGVSAEFKKLIVSLQFHEITRQLVEHVIAVLQGLCSDHHAPGAGAYIVVLQSMQLASASESFSASIETVCHNLDEISAGDQPPALPGTHPSREL